MTCEAKKRHGGNLNAYRQVREGNLTRAHTVRFQCYDKPEKASCCPVGQSCLTVCDPMDCSTPGFPVLHHLLEFTQTHVHWVSDAIQPSHPLSSHLLLPSIFASIRVFSNESVLWMTWPKYWSFSFSISPSNEYSVLISFGLVWSCCARDSQESSPASQFKSIDSSFSVYFMVQLSYPYMTTENTIALTRWTLSAK